MKKKINTVTALCTRKKSNNPWSMTRNQVERAEPIRAKLGVCGGNPSGLGEVKREAGYGVNRTNLGKGWLLQADLNCSTELK